ncbi:MAG: YggS family pyridoxal phosphate-dependent enzyme [Planctomyces sp.]|nr:YggS family pyridoxal phosphate-dependent enzyme [Planctomyces sp.]
MTQLEQRLRRNIAEVSGHIAAAAVRAGRSPGDVTLVAVTKSAPDAVIPLLAGCGLDNLGESRPQRLAERQRLAPDARWHLIGHLQRNKVRDALAAAELIHSVDSLRLLERISQVAGELGHTARLLLEVNISGEAAKHGFSPDELRAHWADCQRIPHVELAGLMTMAPLSDDPETARPPFRGLRELRDELRAATGLPLSELSMGMSGDYEIGVEEGATLVRVGSALFEGLETP